MSALASFFAVSAMPARRAMATRSAGAWWHLCSRPTPAPAPLWGEGSRPPASGLGRRTGAGLGLSAARPGVARDPQRSEAGTARHALTRHAPGRASVVVRAGKCACGKTSDKDGNCDGAPALCVTLRCAACCPAPSSSAATASALSAACLLTYDAQARTPRRCAAAVVRALLWRHRCLCLNRATELSAAFYPQPPRPRRASAMVRLAHPRNAFGAACSAPLAAPVLAC